MSIPPNSIEIRRLIAVAEREAADANVAGLSPDGSYEHSYNAALTLATIVVRAYGERIHGADHHRLTFEALARLADGRWAGAADYFQHSRRRRNTTVYDTAGTVSKTESKELATNAQTFANEVREWLRTTRPELLS